MKKISVIAAIILFSQAFCAASTFGTYRPEYEYGIFDGLKFKVWDRKKDEKIIDLKDDIDKKLEKTEESKELQDKKDDDEYQMYKFMLDNTVPI